MTPDRLLERMLKFANSPDCPPDRKREVENGAWKTWADSITEHNPFAYEKVKHEKISIKDVFKYNLKMDISKLDIELIPNKEPKKIRQKRKLSKKIINTETGKVHNSSGEEAEILGISPKLLTHYLKGTTFNPTKLLYISDYERRKKQSNEKANK
mgnify:FL=1